MLQNTQGLQEQQQQQHLNDMQPTGGGLNGSDNCGIEGTPATDCAPNFFGDAQDVIQAAVSSMMGVAARVNEMKAGHRWHVRIQELQSELSGWYGPDLTRYGPILLEVSEQVALYGRVGGPRGFDE